VQGSEGDGQVAHGSLGEEVAKAAIVRAASYKLTTATPRPRLAGGRRVRRHRHADGQAACADRGAA
jgi:hypothetical protein